ncbi:hypothetical protein BBP40_002837 [Aspergillus hancockii]|nr:hypothetical protein BBP40_002837 [Aspergillus hancockii]
MTTRQSAGPHSIFDSPQKEEMPALRAPNSQPFLFSQNPSYLSSKNLNPLFGQSAFMTPRKFDLDLSSGAEGMSSSENAENVDTPEQPMEAGHRDLQYGILNHYSNALARRVQKRRRRDTALGLHIRKEESGDDSDRPRSSEGQLANKKNSKQKNRRRKETQCRGCSPFSEFFALLEAHPNIPSVPLWWAQLVVNLSLFSLAVYVMFGFVSTIGAEFEQTVEEVSNTILAEMAVCEKRYAVNKCTGGERLPALETLCEDWENCMKRDPAKVRRVKVTAHTMAIIINGFVDPISWKAIMFFLATISTVTVVSNWSFRSFRNRFSQRGYAPPAPTFSRQPSGYHHPPMPSSQYPYQHNPGLGYGDHTRGLP